MTRFSKKDRQGLLLMAGVAIAVCALFAINWYVSNKPALDAQSCRAPVERKTVIIVDRSDDTPVQTVREIAARIKRFTEEEAQENELISLFEISSSSRTALEPVFSACLPRRDGNDLYENRRRIQRHFQEHFARPLDAALSRPPAVSESSPISEVLSDVSASQYLNGGTNRLIVFSDMLQNSENVSLYNCTSSRDAVTRFRASRSGAIERPTFSNTSVHLNLIPREGIGSATVACREGFWAWFFGDNEGAEAGLDISTLPGGAPLS